MSATYNWAYKPGVTNTYGFTIPSTADNVRPNGYCYIALFGNDVTGNGSRQLPYRTFAKAVSVTGGITYIFGSGVYREAISNPAVIVVGDGNVIFNGVQLGPIESIFSYNVKFINWTNSFSTLHWQLTDVIFENCVNCFSNMTSYGGLPRSWKNVIFNNCTGIIRMGNGSGLTGYMNQVTFYNCPNLGLIGDDALNSNINIIFHSCNIWFEKASCTSFSLFYNCKFAFGGTRPISAAGFTSYTTISDLRAGHLTNFPGLVTNFVSCAVADPKFNNISIGDLSLAFDSPARNLSYFGTYIGARSIAYPLKAGSSEDLGNFDYSTMSNLSISEDSITLNDPTFDGSICTKIVGNFLGRELAKISVYGFNADRNGQYIDSIADLDPSTKSAGDTLIIPASYLVETGAIVYNGATYQPGERLTTTTGQTTFTTVSSGVLREILEAPQRNTIEARFGNGGTIITSGSSLVIDNWYCVLSGSVTYNSNTITSPALFKAINTNSFAGSGIVELAMSTENYQHYEPGIRPTSNNSGDTRTGIIIRGNGDPTYIRGGVGVKEFPINAKYMQFKFTIRTNNLKP